MCVLPCTVYLWKSVDQHEIPSTQVTNFCHKTKSNHPQPIIKENKMVKLWFCVIIFLKIEMVNSFYTNIQYTHMKKFKANLD
jgi:hypothetical protein